jgi:hypothetical protein
VVKRDFEFWEKNPDESSERHLSVEQFERSY